MAGGKQALLGATLIAVAALAAIVISALGHDAAPATAEAFEVQRAVHPPMRPATAAPLPQSAAPDAGSSSEKGGSKSKRPSITDLVTSVPVTVDPASSRIAVLSCGKSQGIALDGGIIAPPAPAQVVVTMLSRANPNPPFANSRRNYYVGVRNLDPVNSAQFRATLVCAKRIDVK